MRLRKSYNIANNIAWGAKETGLGISSGKGVNGY